jgi:hypothetical protein
MEVNGTTSLSQLPVSGQISGNVEQPLPNTNIQMIPPNSNNMNNIVLTKNEIIAESNNQMQPQQMQPRQMQAPSMQAQQMQAQSMQAQQMQAQQIPQQAHVMKDQSGYNELVGQLQQASSVGATSLPSRDIPINPMQVSNDVEVKPNFIPEPPIHEDYINNMETPDNMIMKNNQQQYYADNLDAFYSEFQLPVIVAILYFLFQLPIFRRSLKKILPSLFGQDGNPNLYGYFFNSALYSTMFYVLLKLINQLNMHVN